MGRLRRAGEHQGHVAPAGGRRWSGARPRVLDLGDRSAHDPTVAGNKAAALARAAARGFPVLAGFVISTEVGEIDLRPGPGDGPGGPAAGLDWLYEPWDRLSRHGRRPLVVRSSSTGEDAESSSMAGRFTSVGHVSGWPAFLAAVEEVLASSDGQPMAVLVQPHLEASVGGVLFTVDPVTGRHHPVVEAVAGGPEALVSGTARSTRLRLGRGGRIAERDVAGEVVTLSRATRRALVRLARAVEAHAGRPQDVEWAVDRAGTLWLLQHRPVTAAGDARPVTPLLGAGPVAETFPHPLRPLEVDLWVAPLEEGLRQALSVAGAASGRRLAGRPPVRVVGGRVVADLELLGVAARGGWLHRLDPRPPARRLAAAWRVGRLRQALPAIAATTVAAVDARLGEVPRLDECRDAELVGVLHRARRTLVTTSGYEVLAGMLLDGRTGATEPSAAELALAALAEADPATAIDDDLVAARPEVLALWPPAIGAAPRLPSGTAVTSTAGRTAGLDVTHLGSREALRLRSRWLQELSARAALELGLRLAARGVLRAPERVALLTLDELETAVTGAPLQLADADLDARSVAAPSLPARFRLSASGQPVAVATGHRPGGGSPHGRPAGGGRGEGVAVHPGDPAGGPVVPGAVLVVEHLSPDLAPLLPHLSGLVAETGSALSHLAILARELDVATVVGVDDARARFPAGSRLLVDGTTGSVTRQDEGR